ncbi:MAG: hypothetical protein OS130_04835 [Thermodesulfobacteriota bacterium]|jgi:hypothetical protein|nr:MAG: hypothetical protein OS130_04835 [Thermodesulfobacteriota bacterium]
MTTLSPEEEQKKREIFEAMSPKRQQGILKKGYENWDPFQKPKEPFDRINGKEGDRERLVSLWHQFLKEKDFISPSNAFLQGAFEICRGILEEDERYRGMLEFCLWYKGKREEKI